MRFDDYERLRTLLVNHALASPSFEDWRHRWVDNALWQQLGIAEPIGWVLETTAGEIVGSMQSIPVRYTFEGSDLVAGASAAWCVAASYRGYALQLIDEYFSQSADLFISTTVGPAAIATLSQFYGPVPLGEWDTTSHFITGHISFAKRALQKYHVPAAELLAYPVGWTLSVKSALSRDKLPEAPRDLSIEATDKFDSRFDVFWDELVRENREKLLAERSSRALSWHFEAALHGNRLWIFTACKSDRLYGYCVLRKEPAVDGREVSLIDYQSLDQERDLLSSFLRMALRRCAAEGVQDLQNLGMGVPKMHVVDEHAHYRRKLTNPVFFYRAAHPTLAAKLRHPRHWDPSLFDGDATL